MNDITVKTAPGAFANGFEFFCANCGIFFSLQIKDGFDKAECGRDYTAEYCPSCGGDDLLQTTGELLYHCRQHLTDPVNFFHAFPPHEPIPESRTGATPHEVEWIIGCVCNDKTRKLPITVESYTDQLGFDKEVVKKVFEELHITETGGNL